MAGAVDLAACQKRWGPTGKCRCTPICRICGHGPHMAVHGPLMGQSPGTKPWGHEFEPERGPQAKGGGE